jgi:hypothetical protein
MEVNQMALAIDDADPEHVMDGTDFKMSSEDGDLAVFFRITRMS